jgi:hypothetical protein
VHRYFSQCPRNISATLQNVEQEGAAMTKHRFYLTTEALYPAETPKLATVLQDEEAKIGNLKWDKKVVTEMSRLWGCVGFDLGSS